MEIEELISALKHCTSETGDCRTCPGYTQNSGCLDRLHAKAAETLESQQKRIEGIHDYLRPKKASTLQNMRKTELIEYIRQLEHNYNAEQYFLNEQAKNIERLLTWTPVGCGLPPMHTDAIEDDEGLIEYLVSDTVLACTADGQVVAVKASIEEGKTWWFDSNGEECEVTHWMPVKPPKEAQL